MTPQMTPDDFVNNIVYLYHEARKIRSFEPSVPNNVIRGHSKCVASDIEDLLATYIATNIKDIKIYVNQPIIYNTNKKKIKIQPDIVITRKAKDDNEEIIYLADLKNDLGYQRHLINEPETTISRDNTYWKYVDIVNQLKQNNVFIQDKLTKVRSIGVLNTLRYDLIIITGENSGKKPSDFLSRILDINCQNIPLKVWVLTTGCHPNNYNGTKNPTTPSADLTNLIKNIP